MTKQLKKGIFLLAIILSLASCKKAVQTFTILGTWQVDTYTENGVDKTTAWKAIWQNYKIDFDISKDFTETATVSGLPYTNVGKYEMINGGDDIILTNQSDSSVRNYHIIDIKVNSAQYSEAGGTKVYHLSKI